jgi:endonuclease/exonuclease/phosphatase (EEP) superfamily protein YafD
MLALENTIRSRNGFKDGRSWGRFSLIVSVLCFLFLAVPGRPQTITNLKVMSFNVLVGGTRGITNIAEVIRRSGADLVGLQEIAGYPSSLTQLATNLGFHYVPGISIVSRYPILASAVSANNETQSGATIELSPGQRVHLFNCHLAAYPYGPYYWRDGQSSNAIITLENTARLPALTNLLAAMAPRLGGPEPVFLTGDFNAPSHLDYTAFPWPTSVAPIKAGLLDSYRLIHSMNRLFPPVFSFTEAGVTWTPDGFQQDPNDIFDRIDFVYFSGSNGTTVTASTELDGRNSLNPWPSDHRAVLSTFTLTPPAPAAKATRPYPASGASRVGLINRLSWLPASNATAHIIYFGTNPPGSLIVTQASAVFNPGPLTNGVTYYWRVDEVTPSGVATGDEWTFNTGAPNLSSLYEWTFDHADLSAALGNGVMSYADAATPGLIAFGASDGSSVPHIGGQSTTYLHVPGFTDPANGFHLAFPDSGPNGGGVYLNQFSFIADLLIPGSIGWTALFNTNPQNANDADFYIDPNARLGVGALAYSADDTLMANTWHRVAFVADLGAGTVTFYRDGVQAAQRTGASLLDGRFSLYSNADPGPDLLLFNEGDSGGVYTHALLVSSIAFTDRALSATEMSALGGPRADGIFARRLRVSRDDNLVLLAWNGGPGVRLQKTTNLSTASWQDIAGTLGVSSFAEPAAGASTFYRLNRQ